MQTTPLLKASGRLPDARRYKIVFIIWLVISPCLLIFGERIAWLRDLFECLVSVYFIWGLWQYARFKGSRSSAFTWLIGLTLATMLFGFMDDKKASEMDDGQLLLALLSPILLVALYVAMFNTGMALRKIREKYMSCVIFAYLGFAALVHVGVVLVYYQYKTMPVGIDAMFDWVSYASDVCFYFLCCRFFLLKEKQEEGRRMQAGSR